jgi:hypothetical protein
MLHNKAVEQRECPGIQSSSDILMAWMQFITVDLNFESKHAVMWAGTWGLLSR